jgi:hypothetical protein
MSYKVFINSGEVELVKGVTFAQTKQANDIANLTTRNSNFTQNIKLARTSENERILLRAGLIGSNSRFPYQRNTCDVIDIQSGQHLIWHGWAVLLSTDSKAYNITVYDGSIDFYRAIENLTITQVGISDLNHIKNIDNIIETWTDLTKPYRYVLADYNGDNIIEDVKINIDYQVPSANCKYIWDRIFDYIGFTYSGSVFNHEKFIDLWLSFPKPTGEEVPNKIQISQQESSDISYVVNVNVGNAVFQVTQYVVNPLRDCFTSEYAVLQCPAVNWNDVNGEPIPFVRSIQILQTGVYSFDLNDSRLFRLRRADALNQLIELIDFNETIIFNANAGDLISFFLVQDQSQLPQLPPTNFNDLEITFSYIDGFAVNFEEIFIDFKVSDFIREILVRFGLTPYKDKFTNEVRFLTLPEIFQNTQIEDWSTKFGRVVNESYKFGNYAKRNTFKYKYNDVAQTHNNGFISIDNDNLAEEVVLFQSQIYSPEAKTSLFLGNSNVYKLWEREIKEDNTIDYKELEGRFYFQRSRRVNGTLFLASNLTSQEEQVSFYYRESYHRLRWQDIVFDWYPALNQILDNSKLITVEVWLKAFEVANLELSRLIFISQLSQYFLINKVSNFVNGRPTRVELIKVDYYTTPEIELPTTPIIDIELVSLVDCSLVFDVITENLLQPTTVTLTPFTLQGTVTGVPDWFVYTGLPPITATLDNNQVSFDISSLPPNSYKFVISGFGDAFTPVSTQQTEIIVLDGDCYDGGLDLPTEVEILSVVNNGIVEQFPFSFYSFTINFDFDELPLGTLFYNIDLQAFRLEAFGQPEGWYGGGQYQFSINADKTINALVPLSGGGGEITKLRILINGTISNEFIL